MWKAFSRFVKEPLERKLALKKNKKESVENNGSKTHRSCCQILPRQFCSNDGERCREQTNKNNAYKDAHFLGDQNFWLEAAGLGGAFGFGWIISQNLYFKQRKIISEKGREYHKRFSFLRQLLSKYVLLAQPGDEIKALPEFNSDVVCDHHVSTYGPKSAREAIDEAATELISAHNEAIAELEYRVGVRLMSKKRYKKAVTHFSAASTLHNASAMYNLARCYELGLGTRQDFKKAAQYYQAASNMGHAGSLYNLGMFYAHGWGGLPFSSEKAKKLFTEAAELGQPEAKAIIELENKYPPALCHLDNSCISAASGVRSNNESHDITDVIEAVKNLSILKKNGRNNDDLKRNRSSSNSSTGYSSSSSTNGGGILSVYSDLSSISSSSDVSDPAQKSADNFSGICYENGIGVKRDINKAMNFYEKAAHNGHSEALYNLASCYEGTFPSDGDAFQTSLIIELYKIAARHGHKYAEERLNKLELHHELGILTDYLKKNTEG